MSGVARRVRLALKATRLVLITVSLVVLPVVLRAQTSNAGRGVRVVRSDAARRVDIYVGGEMFTSYIYPETLTKPVLYPVRAAGGIAVTRGFPFEPRAGERVDHPHHVGLWFNYGDVNGVDFWNNSTALAPEEQKKMGTIRHRRVRRTENGATRGVLEVECDWIMPDGSTVLRERTRFVFHAPAAAARFITRTTTLAALDRPVVFRDNKEGLLGLRVARGLEQPSDKPEIFLDASGRPTTVPALDNAGVTGEYRSSEGARGDAVWGTRGRWALLAGRVAGVPMTLAMLDHPRNPGYPTYWHARGYGLFAANPLGQKVFAEAHGDKAAKELLFTLAPRQSTTFRHRLAIITNAEVAPARIDAEQRRFAAEPD